MEYNKWWKLRNQNLAVYCRNAGFDLAIFDQYSTPVQEELKKRTIKEAVEGIKSDFMNESGFQLTDIKKGVYVISVSTPFSVLYNNNSHSQVIYIGMGNIIGRIDSHLKGSLFKFMQSLSGANFDFHFANPHFESNDNYYKHVEYLMINYFEQKFGGKRPLLNSNAGSDKAIEDDNPWWTRPLKNAGARPQWHINPTDKNKDFGFLD